MRIPHSLSELYQEVRFCNCADCGRELLGQNQLSAALEAARSLIGVIPVVAGRIKERPYCDRCLSSESSGNVGSVPAYRTQEYHDRVYHGA